MEDNKKIYWKGLEELTNDTEFIRLAEKEFPENLPIKDSYGDNTASEPSRRDFLKLMGFSVAAVSLAACEAPVRKAIPWLNKPEDITPGIPNYYASTYIDGSEYCAIVVKTREGRPIFVEGNTFSSVTKGGTSPTVNASIMGLYDAEKATSPSVNGKETSWDAVDKEIIGKLNQIAQSGGQIRIVSNTNMSPSTKLAIDKFVEKYPTAKHIAYDQVSAYGITEANRRQFGKAYVPSYHFDKAQTVVSFGADFLGTWISPIEYASQFATTRKVGKDKKQMSRLYAFESIMSLTGANADYRTPLKPSQEGLAVAKLYNLIAQKAGASTINTPDVKLAFLEKAASNLWDNRGKALVVSGSNDPSVQLLVNAINEMLESYGNTINLDVPSFQKQGNDADMLNFVKELNAGSIAGVIFYNANPVYDHAQGTAIEAAIKKASLTVAISDRRNETGALCAYHCPDRHYLESWNDAEPKKGYFSIGQPTIKNIFDTRQGQQSLLTWAETGTDYLDLIKDFWKTKLYPLQDAESNFEAFWTRSLHNGVFEPATSNYKSVFETDSDKAQVGMDDVAQDIAKNYKAAATAKELVIYPKVTIGAGTQANNPYLHETPDPITKVCWGNYVSIPMAMAKELGFAQKEVNTNTAVVKVGNASFELPVVIQPGQANDTIAIALGFGRSAEKAGKVAAEAGGASVYPLISTTAGFAGYYRTDAVSIESAGTSSKLPQTQTHQTFMGRESIIQESILAKYVKDEKAGRFFPKIATSKGPKDPVDISLWDIRGDGYGKRDDSNLTEVEKDLWNVRNGSKTADKHIYPNHHWGMAIDLNSCTGCSACIVACHIENNVPIVGRTEVIKRREMHWLRIDRYYSSDGAPKDYNALEIASENPEVVFQPMMCQHCNNAPCETVCPVAATTHSSEGINQMTYNRCVGTKYCANNCPYKVRRFNWFKYHNNNEFDYNMNNDLGRMVLNPDVTVRSRGVMEKCSLCVQRIQGGKLKAKSERRKLEDGEVITACAAACSSGAIVFGDLNNPQSKVSQLLDHEINARAYNVLHEINTRPNVWYLTKIRNKDEAQA